VFLNLSANRVFQLFAILFVSLAIVGAVRSYSIVPFWDMWDGYLNFYIKTLDGDRNSWWAQHNEHRIVLAKILFWIDLKYFEGRSIFLIIINYLLVGFAAAVFWILSREQRLTHLPYIKYFVVSVLFCWCQAENLTWAFQSQFFMAQSIPLAAFTALYFSATNEKRTTFFYALAIVLGCLSAVTMANGVLALPLLFVQAICMRLQKKQIILIGIIAAIVITVYFLGYESPSNHGTIASTLKQDPLGVIHYVLLYIGGPIVHVAGGEKWSHYLALLAGTGLIFGATIFLAREIFSKSPAPLTICLLIFLVYIGGSALGTAGGRLKFGVEQALAYRYSTPTLMAWLAFLLLLLPKINGLSNRFKNCVPIAFSLILVLMLPLQFKAIRDQSALNFEKQLATLAVELKVEDQSQIKNIAPSADWVFKFADKASALNLSVFNTPQFKNAHKQINQLSSAKNLSLKPCQGSFDGALRIDDPTFLRFKGWMFTGSKMVTPSQLLILDDNMTIRGFALTGDVRPDVALAIERSALNSGFMGYVNANLQGQKIKIVDTSSGCFIETQLPIFLFASVTKPVDFELANVKLDSITLNDNWHGGDYFKSQLIGLIVYGSFITGDKDAGNIQLRLKRGDSFYYRTGPSINNQTIELIGRPETLGMLPEAKDWALLTFNSPLLPNEFEIRITDKGKEWGEWSAIALRK
jgi:hypothetical protein